MSETLFQVTHTKIQSFQRCRKQYWFSYVSGLDWPPSRDTPAAIVGKGVHRAMRRLCETDHPEDAEHELDAYLRMPKHHEAAPGDPSTRPDSSGNPSSAYAPCSRGMRRLSMATRTIPNAHAPASGCVKGARPAPFAIIGRWPSRDR